MLCGENISLRLEPNDSWPLMSCQETKQEKETVSVPSCYRVFIALQALNVLGIEVAL